MVSVLDWQVKIAQVRGVSYFFIVVHFTIYIDIYCIVLICWSLLLARLFSELCIRSWYVNHNVGYIRLSHFVDFTRGVRICVCVSVTSSVSFRFGSS